MDQENQRAITGIEIFEFYTTIPHLKLKNRLKELGIKDYIWQSTQYTLFNMYGHGLYNLCIHVE
jgi:hypothetical protein